MADTEAIANCRFAFECTQRWRDLAPVRGHRDVRYCAACQTAVHLCVTAEEFRERTALGHCVALVRVSQKGSRAEPQGDEMTFTLGIPIEP